MILTSRRHAIKRPCPACTDLWPEQAGDLACCDGCSGRGWVEVPLSPALLSRLAADNVPALLAALLRGAAEADRESLHYLTAGDHWQAGHAAGLRAGLLAVAVALDGLRGPTPPPRRALAVSRAA